MMMYGRSIMTQDMINEQLERERKQKRLTDPLTTEGLLLEEFDAVKSDLYEMLVELRQHMTKIYNLQEMINNMNIAEERLMYLEQQFNKHFKTEKVNDKPKMERLIEYVE